ncbi:MAG: hypothetical protein PVH77_11000 [Phycisphaerales bacterium]|jgi:hypothetical protein
MVSLDKKIAIDMCFKLCFFLSKGEQLLRIKLYRNSLLLISLFLTLPINGCGYPDKYPSHFRKIQGSPNAFRMYVIQPFGLFQPRERVCGVRVTVRNSGIPEVYWEIKADEPIDAEGFEIVAGQVPEGFQQVKPNPEKRFDPIPGKRYFIEVDLEHPLAMPWVETLWVAD